MKPAIEIAQELLLNGNPGWRIYDITKAITDARREAYKDAIRMCVEEKYEERVGVKELMAIEQCIERIEQAMEENCKLSPIERLPPLSEQAHRVGAVRAATGASIQACEKALEACAWSVECAIERIKTMGQAVVRRAMAENCK